jgi:hypothetical protein
MKLLRSLPPLVLVAGVAACGSPRTSAPAAAAVREGEVRSISVQEFQQLRWVEGRWRGDQPDGKPFYEAYRFVNDSTIRSYSYADSASGAVPSDSGFIALRGGEVTTGGEGARWVASQLTASRIDFAPRVGASNSFTWQRASADAWTATLRWPATADRPAREVIYPMRRLAP